MTDRRSTAPPGPATTAGAEGAAPEPAAVRSGAATTVVWAAALQAVAAFVAHDFRNTLNAVAVNLEVVRERSARGAEAGAIAPFAATARAQFEIASGAAEALLDLSRSERGEADVVAATGRLARLLAVRGAGTLRCTAPPTGVAVTSAPPDVVRTVVARSVLSALAAGGTAACEITVADGILLRVHGSANASPSLDPAVTALATAFEVGITVRGHALELRFPKPGTAATIDAPA